MQRDRREKNTMTRILKPGPWNDSDDDAADGGGWGKARLASPSTPPIPHDGRALPCPHIKDAEKTPAVLQDL